MKGGWQEIISRQVFWGEEREGERWRREGVKE